MDGCSWVFDLDVDAMGAGVNVTALLAEESDEGDAGFPGVFDGETGWWSDSCYYLYASDGCFLDQFEAGAAA